METGKQKRERRIGDLAQDDESASIWWELSLQLDAVAPQHQSLERSSEPKPHVRRGKSCSSTNEPERETVVPFVSGRISAPKDTHRILHAQSQLTSTRGEIAY